MTAIQPIGRLYFGRRRGTVRRLAATKRLAFGTAVAGLALLVLATQVSGQPITTGGVGPQTGPTYPEIAELPDTAASIVAPPRRLDGRSDPRDDAQPAPPPRGDREPTQTR
jgi:hypothetical protein